MGSLEHFCLFQRKRGLFSTPDLIGASGEDGGWLLYLLDRTGLMLCGRYWPTVASSFVGLCLLLCLIALAWSCRVLKSTLCCCCGRYHPVDGASSGVPSPPALAQLPRVPTSAGFISLQFRTASCQGRGHLLLPQYGAQPGNWAQAK